MKVQTLLCGLLLALSNVHGALPVSINEQTHLPGTLVVDKKNFWGHNGRFAKPNYKAAYVVCDGYIGSPLIPNSRSAVETFLDNCELTPPPGALPIIDSAENHSTYYNGYPAYPVQVEGSDHTYFLCDGFLSSSAWCSYEAHAQAQKLRRAAESRFWEPGSNPVMPQENSSINEEAQKPFRASELPKPANEEKPKIALKESKPKTTKPIKHSELLKPELVKLKEVKVYPASENQAEEKLVGYKVLPVSKKEEVEEKYNVKLGEESSVEPVGEVNQESNFQVGEENIWTWDEELQYKQSLKERLKPLKETFYENDKWRIQQ